ncbi:MAG: primosomal protein N' [Candidatus Gastranaerophilales bacterium]|nr:primosomal protein N' [Candidatus Gastranaerophilales bacterium]MCM1072608.1 primosomal protein N' [Bacteroides sp.]
MKYALVLVNIKGLGVKTFSYIIPDEMKEIIQIGQAVLVPFGRQGLINAFIVGFSDYLPDGIRAKKINRILDETPLFSIKYLKLLEWVANYYCTDFVTVLNAAIPMKLIEKNSKTEQSVELIKDDFEGLTKRQKEVLELLKTEGKSPLIEFEEKAKTTRATMKKLAEAGYVKISLEYVYRNPLTIFKDVEVEPLFELSADQQAVYEGIRGKLKSPNPILLHGVTASGKTEVYFKLIKDVLDSGKNVLFMAPEIALASQLTKRLARKFGIKDVAIWHSSISDGEKYDVWQRLYNNEIRILAGARSAVFAPLQNIGLIIIDEEHEGAYKQTNPAPRYDARVVARRLAQFHQAPLLLGSATPDVSTYYFAQNNNNIFQMLKRFNNAPLAKPEVINMQEYGKAAYRSIISKPLQTEIKEAVENGKQVILLMNRRGFSTYTQCKACGTVVECPDCSIPMVWHADGKKLKCHYCSKEMSFPDFCPQCGSDALSNSGSGTQKIEILVKELFPDYRVERIDSDILTKKNAHIELLGKFQKGEIDILVGTQMIAKGLDNPNVTLVGVISADTGFSVPDFRASERGFQLLTQVAGRAGRGEYKGKVLFQTYNPDYYAFQTAKSQNYDKFFETEIKARQEFDYPPFSQIIRLILSSQNNFRAEKSAMEIAMRLVTMTEKFGFTEYLETLGPTPCIISKINGYYRFQILIKNKLSQKGHDFVSKFMDKITLPKDIKLAIDVDPLDIL